MNMNKIGINKSLTFIQIIFLFIILNYNAYFLVPSFEFMREYLGFSDTLLGFLSGGYLFANGLSTLIWAYISEARLKSRKNVLSISFLLASLFILIEIFARSPLFFLLLFILAGFSLGSVLPLGFSIIADIFVSEERTQAYTLWYTFGGFGISLGIAISSIVIAILGFRFTLLIDALFLLMGSVLSWLIKEPVRGWADIGLKTSFSRYAIEFSISMKDIKLLLKNKINLLLIFEGALQVIPDTVILIWGFQFIMRDLSASSVVALVYLSIVGTGAFGGILLARVVDKIYAKNKVLRPLMSVIFCLLSALFFISFFQSSFELDIYDTDIFTSFFKITEKILSNSYIFLASLLYFMGKFVNTPLGPIKESVLADINLPEHRAIIKSFMIIIELVSRSISALLVGLLSDLTGEIRMAIIYMLSPWILASFIWIIISHDYESYYNKARSELEKRIK